MSPWRAVARQVIELALRDGREQGLEGRALDRFVSARYPFGERAMHPYKIWLSECRIQVRGEVRKTTTGHTPDLPGQGRLFDE